MNKQMWNLSKEIEKNKKNEMKLLEIKWINMMKNSLDGYNCNGRVNELEKLILRNREKWKKNEQNLSTSGIMSSVTGEEDREIEREKKDV